MSNTQNMENTTVEKIDIDIDEIFGAGVGNITLPEENKKPNIFERPNQNVDFSFAESSKDEDLKNEVQDENDETVLSSLDLKENSREAGEDILGGLDSDDDDDDEKIENRGRKSIDGFADVINRMVKSEKLFALSIAFFILVPL